MSDDEKVDAVGWGFVDETCPECNSSRVVGAVNETNISEHASQWTEQLLNMGILKPSYFQCQDCNHKWGDKVDGS
tara:strand:+ start:1550 stop:1774 length:225 start_codon:yes stop_codon:yes gene_type:complete